MLPGALQPVSTIVSRIACAAAGADTGHTQGALSRIDQAFSITALLLVAAAVGRFVIRPGWDPLRAAPRRPNRLGADALALAIAVYFVAAAVIAGVVQAATGQMQGVAAAVFVGNGAHTAGIVACLVIAAGRFEGGITGFWSAKGSPRLSTSILVTGLATLAAVGLCPAVRDAAVSVILRFVPDYEFAPHPTIKALGNPSLSPGGLVALWAGAVVIAPVAEELFFRGLLQTFLVKVLNSRWAAVALASLAFGVVHVQQPQAIAALTVLALLIGYVYERTGSLLPPILLHAAFNLKTLIWDALGGLEALTFGVN